MTTDLSVRPATDCGTDRHDRGVAKVYVARPDGPDGGVLAGLERAAGTDTQAGSTDRQNTERHE